MTLGAIFDVSETELERLLTGFIVVQLRAYHGVLLLGIVSKGSTRCH
jgi:hypothetical protein